MSYPLVCAQCGAANLPQAVVCIQCGQQLQAAAQKVVVGNSTGFLPIHYLLNSRYLITGQVGKGGMGAVYKAEDTKLGSRLVAIKEMSQSRLSAQEIIAATNAFKQEAHMLAGLHHPNLPSIHDYFSEAGRSYLVMAFIESETLEHYLHTTRHGYLTIKEVLDIGIQLCTALDYLHTRQPPIIFRDLKPSNIMWTPNGHLYLIDFGIVRHFKPGQSKDTNALGTLGYAAPEQYGKAQTTPRADIYSLGATLHYLLSGNDPVNSPFRFAPLQFQDQPKLFELEELVMQMLDMDEHKRPDSIHAIKQELQRIAAMEDAPMGSSLRQTTSPVAVTHSTHPPQPLVNPRPVLPVQEPAATLAAATYLGTTLYTYRNFWLVHDISWSPDGKLIASASKNVQVWEALTGNAILTYRGHAKMVKAVAWSPDQTSSTPGRGYRIASGGDDKTVQVWNAANGNNVATYFGHAHLMRGGSVRAVIWSPDATLIASGGHDRTVQIWHVATGGDIYTYYGHAHWLKGGSVNALAWSPNGQFIASGGGDKTLQVWEALTGNYVFAYRGNTAEVHTLKWSPDNKRIVSGDRGGRVRLWEVATGECIFTYATHTGPVKTVDWSPDGKYIACGSDDTTVQIWDANSGNHVFTYSQHSASIKAVAWSPDSTLLASASEDNTVQVWQPK